MTTFEADPAMLAEIAPLARQYRAASADAAQQGQVAAKYLEVLRRFRAAGWDGALGEEHEIPDACLPADYLSRRSELLSDLEDELGRVAMDYRSAATPILMAEAVADYQAVYDEMCRIGHWHGEPDPDSQLPPDDMPVRYQEQQEERIRRYRARQASAGKGNSRP